MKYHSYLQVDKRLSIKARVTYDVVTRQKDVTTIEGHVREESDAYCRIVLCRDNITSSVKLVTDTWLSMTSHHATPAPARPILIFSIGCHL